MYRRKNNVFQNISLMLIDCGCIILSIFFACLFRFNNLIIRRSDITGLMIMYITAYLLLYFVVNFNANFSRQTIWQHAYTILKINIGLLFVTTFLMYSFRTISLDFSRTVTFLTFGFNCILMMIFHTVFRFSMDKYFDSSHNGRQLLLVTTSQLAAQVIQKINAMDRWDYTINAIALVDRPMPKERMDIEGIHVVADVDTLVEYCKTALVDEVLFYGDTFKLASMNAVRKISSMGITVHINIDLIDMQIQAADRTITNIADFYTATFANRFLTTRQQIVKRVMDIFGSIIGLILVIPITIIFAPIIYIQSPGPIFFKQKRVGRNGRYFYIYKFRSMYPDAEKRKAALMAENEMDGFMFKMENDPRIFPIGRFMRKTSLDEFPQFWNVLKGDMSLVGTRPPTLDEFSKYKSHHKKRLSTRPGLTGLWQVSGRNKITDFEEVVRLDVEYINQWSVWLDLKIIFKTLGVMVQRKGR